MSGTVPSGQRKWTCLPACQSCPFMSLQVWIFENTIFSVIWCWVKGNGISDSVDNRLRQKASVGIQEGKHGFWLDLYRTPRHLLGHRVSVSNVTSKSQELRDLSRTQGPLGRPHVTCVTDILARAWCQTRIRELRMALFPGGPFLSQTKSNKQCAENCGSAIFARIPVTRKSQREEFV